MTQGIRHSQFIYTYGPGAIIEGTDGPRVVLSPQTGLFFPDSPYLKRIDKYRLDDERMSKGLLDGGKIFRLPSNANEKIRDDEVIYYTNPFPIWKLCLNYTNHNPQEYILYRGSSCPSCNYMRAQQEAIRFVTACPEGHMDEIDWNYLAHRNPDGTSTQCTESELNNIAREMRKDCYVYYRGSGTVSSIRIGCPRCIHPPTNFGQSYSGSLRCSGRFPEREQIGGQPQRRFDSCSRRMKIIQRQASSLRNPEIKTLLSIKSGATRLDVLLREGKLWGALVALISVDMLPKNKDDLTKIFEAWVRKKIISQPRMDEILQSDWEQIENSIRSASEPVADLTYHQLILQEFAELMKGSEDEGIPPISSNPPKSEVLFEMVPHLREWFDGPNGRKFRICPVSKLATITVQTGYRREISDGVEINNMPLPPRTVKYTNTRLQDANGMVSTWYPGIRNLGEGLFIRLDDNDGWHTGITGKSAPNWAESFFKSDADFYDSSLFRDPKSHEKEEMHPIFVWWHTLAHLLIRSIGEEAGYSSASIHERVYIENDGTKVRGGILLYATQAGSEGTLGGLLSLAPYFDRLLEMSFEQLETCSGDPLCIEEKFQNKKYNGAACYGCLMNSETSCEHRNMWLDRHVLLDNLP